jgi:hypothetical protein
MAEGVDGPEAAWRLFDALGPVAPEALVGPWRGAEFPTGHPLDGLLSASGWYGKRFDDAETVHPLLFYSGDRRHVFAVDPARIPIGPLALEAAPRLPKPALHGLVLAARPVLETHAPKARLREVMHRGVVSAAMIYDDQPIIDHFRRIEDDTVLGEMDMRGLAQPYFFLLRRDAAGPAR